MVRDVNGSEHRPEVIIVLDRRGDQQQLAAHLAVGSGEHPQVGDRALPRQGRMGAL